MTRFVLDSSIIMAWWFETETPGVADAVLQALADDASALVPEIWPHEVVTGLALAERKRLFAEADSARFLGLLRELPIAVDEAPAHVTFEDILPIARNHDIAPCDASYLELAMRRGLPLATCNPKLADVAQAVGVPLFNGSRSA